MIVRSFRRLVMVLVVSSHSTVAPSASNIALSGASVRPSRITGGTSIVMGRPLTSTLIGWFAETGIELASNIITTTRATTRVLRTDRNPPATNFFCAYCILGNELHSCTLKSNQQQGDICLGARCNSVFGPDTDQTLTDMSLTQNSLRPLCFDA